jgi:pyruvate formate lyase activating enzyme
VIAMIFGGFQPLTLLDFPDQVACVFFTQGCNLRCGYCHNPQLIGRQSAGVAALQTESESLAFLKNRRRLLDGVVVSGGEPTLQFGLLPFLRRVKDLGLLVKLDTNGADPLVLRDALKQGLLDYVAMDVKHDPSRYAEITGVAVAPSVLAASRDALRCSGVAHEFRTTVVPRFHDEVAMEQIARFCEGATRFVLQSFRPGHVLNPSFRDDASPTPGQLQRLKVVAERFIAHVEVREDNNASRQNTGRSVAATLAG